MLRDDNLFCDVLPKTTAAVKSHILAVKCIFEGITKPHFQISLMKFLLFELASFSKAEFGACIFLLLVS
jgi:hypothetical protein